ncbi:MAG: hypothetical protein GY756_11255 [bacterium]|nr:hypothetical protein [bacterium]
MDRNLISKKLIKILKKDYNKTLVNYHKEFDENLLGSKINLDPRDLIYFIIDVEDQFNLKISTDHILRFKLFTLNQFVEMIVEEIND